MAGHWASLFSGGKDSSWALHRALQSGRDVTRLVTVHPPPGSYLYHVPGTRLAGLAAESIGIPLVEIDPAFEADVGAESAAQGDRELEPLEVALRDLAAEIDLEGVTAGAAASEYQADRLRAMCDRLDLELFTPLWRQDPLPAATAMLDAGFEIVVIRVAAAGLDASWLGRVLDAEALADLERLSEAFGVHLLGEGGEYETLVVDGPHMDRRIELETAVEWSGTHGELRISEARLADGS